MNYEFRERLRGGETLYGTLLNLPSPAIAEVLARSGLDWLFIDCGNRDEHLLHLGARRLSARLDELAIPHTYEEFDGGHGGVRYRWDRSLREMAAVLSGPTRRDPAGRGG